MPPDRSSPFAIGLPPMDSSQAGVVEARFSAMTKALTSPAGFNAASSTARPRNWSSLEPTRMSAPRGINSLPTTSTPSTSRAATESLRNSASIGRSLPSGEICRA